MATQTYSFRSTPELAARIASVERLLGELREEDIDVAREIAREVEIGLARRLRKMPRPMGQSDILRMTTELVIGAIEKVAGDMAAAAELAEWDRDDEEGRALRKAVMKPQAKRWREG